MKTEVFLWSPSVELCVAGTIRSADEVKCRRCRDSMLVNGWIVC